MRLNRFVQLAAAGILAVAFPAFGADEALPKAEKILERYIEVTGGRKAYESHKTETATLTMEFVGKGIKGTGTRYADAANNSREAITIEGIGNIDSGVSNGIAWEANAITGSRVIPGAEKADRLRAARFNAPLFWREMYKSAETTGTDTVDGDECYKVVMTPADGKPETNYYSKKSGLMLKTTRTLVSQMGEVQVEAFARDYKDFGGILVPTKVMQSVMGNEIALMISDVQWNQPIPADKFEPPAEVKKLLAK